MAIDARPLTRPDCFTPTTVPTSSAPAGTPVVPATITGFATVPLTWSSPLLLFDATGVTSDTMNTVSAGIVTSRNFGSGGGGGAAGAAAGGVTGAADDGAAAGVD